MAHTQRPTLRTAAYPIGVQMNWLCRWARQPLCPTPQTQSRAAHSVLSIAPLNIKPNPTKPPLCSKFVNLLVCFPPLFTFHPEP